MDAEFVIKYREYNSKLCIENEKYALNLSGEEYWDV